MHATLLTSAMRPVLLRSAAPLRMQLLLADETVAADDEAPPSAIGDMLESATDAAQAGGSGRFHISWKTSPTPDHERERRLTVSSYLVSFLHLSEPARRAWQ